jgi:aspartyl protease family protein
VKTLILALGGSIVAAVPSLGAAQAISECTVGRHVVDDRGTSGVIVSARGEQCLIKYNSGQTQGWAPSKSLRAAPGAKGVTPAAGATPPALAANPFSPGTPPPPKNGSDAVAILRPKVSGRLVYRADPRGHVVLTAVANGAPVRFLIDTGASLVALTPDDARTAGIARSELVFNRVVQTANGQARAALVLLREIRIGELSVEKVQAAVIESLGQSVLGMSFLGRLKGLELRDGILTIDW